MFVPVVVVPPPPSPRAQELGNRMAELVRIYREEYPDLTSQEVRQAMDVAHGQVRKELGGTNPAILAALITGILAMLGLFAFLLIQRQQTPGGGLPIPYLVISIAVVAALIVIAARVARRK